MRRVVPLRHQDGQRLTDHLVRTIAKDGAGPRVPRQDGSLAIGGDNGIVGRLRHGAEAPPPLPPPRFPPLAPREVAGPDRGPDDRAPPPPPPPAAPPDA